MHKWGYALKRAIPIKDPKPSITLAEYIVGIAARIDFIKKDEGEINLNPCATTPRKRGRAYTDLLIIKKFSNDVNVERFLPPTVSADGGRSSLKFYLATIAGASGIQSLKSIPDLINVLITSVITQNSDKLRKAYDEVKIPYSELVSDFVRTKTTERIINGKKTIVKRPLSYNRISNSPFVMSTAETAYFKSQEGCFDELDNLSNTYAQGVKLDDLRTFSAQFKQKYDEKVQFVEKYSAWKSRRLQGFKSLASISLTKKEMESWRLSEGTRSRAMSNLARMIREAYESKDHELLKLTVSNLNPRHIPGYTLPNTNIWNYVQTEGIFQAVGLKKYYLVTDETRISQIHSFLVGLCEEITGLSMNPPKASKAKPSRHGGTEESPAESKNRYGELDKEDMEE